MQRGGGGGVPQCTSKTIIDIIKNNESLKIFGFKFKTDLGINFQNLLLPKHLHTFCTLILRETGAETCLYNEQIMSCMFAGALSVNVS